MKLHYLPLCFVCSLMSQFCYAQQFISYRGAFEPAPTTAWTDRWANFTPQTTNYPATTTEISAVEITTNTIWSSSNVYHLKGYVYVTNGATLIIEPGTIIRASGKAALIITRGAKIYANGNQEKPIVFTSNNAPNERSPGDWTGIVLCGKSRHNLSLGANARVEGDMDAYHGGEDDEDSSGVFRYVRIEFGGFAPLSASFSLNPFVLYSIGSKTKIDHVQVSFSSRDSFFWVGGKVNATHLISFRAMDDDFDAEFGYGGSVQYAVGHQDATLTNISGTNGIELDNDAQGSNSLPQTNPNFSNITLIGIKNEDKHKRGIHLRRNTSVSFTNSIVINFVESGILFDGRKTVVNAVEGGIFFKNNFFANNGINYNLGSKSDTLGINTATDVATWASNPSFNNELGTTSESANLIDPFNLINPDYRPRSGVTLIEDDFVFTSSEAMLVFPNPANENVQVALNSEYANATVTVQNAMGMTVASSKAFGESVKFDVSGFANGLYIVSVTNAGKAISKTVVINR